MSNKQKPITFKVFFINRDGKRSKRFERWEKIQYTIQVSHSDPTRLEVFSLGYHHYSNTIDLTRTCDDRLFIDDVDVMSIIQDIIKKKLDEVTTRVNEKIESRKLEIINQLSEMQERYNSSRDEFIYIISGQKQKDLQDGVKLFKEEPSVKNMLDRVTYVITAEEIHRIINKEQLCQNH